MADLTPAMLAQALEQGEIRCVFQPKIALSTRRVVGFEALARWRSPTLGDVPPEQFVALAERYGLINGLTMFILDAAVAQLAAWRTVDPALEMAVNLSPCCLSDLTLPRRIGDVLCRHAVAPGRLVLEVTEGAVMADYISAAEVLTRLRIHGVGISIDDFGTGHSSLLVLLRLPFSELKIDQRFVRGVVHDPESLKVVRAIVSLANSMELKVIAEGVADEATAERLIGLGVPTAQGFLFAPALPAADATLLLRMPAETA